LKIKELIDLYKNQEQTKLIFEKLQNKGTNRIQIKGLVGSAKTFVAASVFDSTSLTHIFVLSDKETAAYFYNDLENLFDESSLNYNKKKILFYPASYKRYYEPDKTDNTNVLSRTEILNRINSARKKPAIITYPEALIEKNISKKYLNKNTLKIRKDQDVSIDFITEALIKNDFEYTDFVVEPGQFSVRGGIVDVFSFANDYPYRIEFLGNKIESIRTFDTTTQLSVNKFAFITIVPNIQKKTIQGPRESFLNFISGSSVVWFDDLILIADKMNNEYKKNIEIYSKSEILNQKDVIISELFTSGKEFLRKITNFSTIEFGKQFYFKPDIIINHNISPQPSFNKNFNLLIKNLNDNSKNKIQNVIIADSPEQRERIYSVFEDIQDSNKDFGKIDFTTLHLSLYEGFVDKDLKIACYTDHQIFERYHKFRLRDSLKTKQDLNLKELYNLKKGDYVTHINYGIGRFDGLEKINNNGKEQEAIRLIYKDGDILYVNIHSLHRISKYVGRDGVAPKLHRLGSNAWNNLKNKTKKRVKDIAADLIKLYAQRKASKGFSFSPDTYLQHEIEASFIYQDTPDQLKTTEDTKKDMENDCPMDRLICGDVGFGKTEIAIRAAFKAVSDSKQVAILAPTTILTLQHYNVFKERLENFPCNVEYINRFKNAKAQKQIIKDLENGNIDILIGTHRLLSKDINFKNLGLLIIDEEQKFGVAMKEKLKQLKVNVDTLTLTATPIPRTLQFSLMGARDLSIINTPPQNRYPIQTELHTFNEKIIHDAIMYEIERGGQVFFVNNRVQNILKVTEMIQKICPDIKISIGHGQMGNYELEKNMLGFIKGEYDVLVATTIIESGLDISNVNTIIINNAQNFGLSDLHQLRGRVGRSNKKAFCYLLSPPLSILTNEARKRLKAIEEFTELGSGFNIAMRDLDIRGAGNMLGGEQSGFISDIGFEMYQKILDEAITELKEASFKNLYKKDDIPKEFIKNCQFKTDLEILIPDDYISNITERLNLYKELDNIENEENLINFQNHLTDRFGTIPYQTKDLINTIRLRWMGKKTGLEEIVLRDNKLTGYFIKNQDSDYYESKIFTKVLDFIKDNPKICRMKENDRLSITFDNVSEVNDAIKILGFMKK